MKSSAFGMVSEALSIAGVMLASAASRDHRGVERGRHCALTGAADVQRVTRLPDHVRLREQIEIAVAHSHGESEAGRVGCCRPLAVRTPALIGSGSEQAGAVGVKAAASDLGAGADGADLRGAVVQIEGRDPPCRSGRCCSPSFKSRRCRRTRGRPREGRWCRRRTASSCCRPRARYRAR